MVKATIPYLEYTQPKCLALSSCLSLSLSEAEHIAKAAVVKSPGEG